MVLVEECEQCWLWYRIYGFPHGCSQKYFALLKTKVMRRIFISVGISRLKCTTNNKKKNSVQNCLTKCGKSKMPTLLI